MTKWISVFVLLASVNASADMKFAFNNEEITKVIEAYSKATGQKFVIDPGVRGKATILNPGKVSDAEAFNLLSDALAVNGYAIAKREDTMVIMSARNIQRNLVETVTTLPPLKPERMVTYMMTLKNIPVMHVQRELRILPSKDGEMSVLEGTNQLIITDWTSNLHRVNDVLQKIDMPVDAKVAKVVEASRKDNAERARKAPKKAAAATPDSVIPEGF